jgi:hypothetical protein
VGTKLFFVPKAGLVAWLFFAAGLFCALIFTVSFASQAPNSSGEPWFWVSIGGSLVSTSIVLFLFAQLVHIRASLEKKN